MKVLIVIDMQNDFIDGALGTAEAVAIVDKVRTKIQEYKERGDKIIFTRDTHHKNYLETNEGKHLPVVHCIEGTPGWEIRDGLYVEGADIINKPSFGYTGWSDYDFEEIELVGLCTDICVVSNALILKSLLPEVEIYVYEDLCAGTDPKNHEAALQVMRMCQVNVEKYFK